MAAFGLAGCGFAGDFTFETDEVILLIPSKLITYPDFYIVPERNDDIGVRIESSRDDESFYATLHNARSYCLSSNLSGAVGDLCAEYTSSLQANSSSVPEVTLEVQHIRCTPDRGGSVPVFCTQFGRYYDIIFMFQFAPGRISPDLARKGLVEKFDEWLVEAS